MMRLLTGAALVVLAGCGGGGGSSSGPTCKLVDIGSLGAVQTITISEPTDLNIDGMNNTVNIEGASNICTLSVPGMSNLIHFNNAITVEQCDYDGMSNIIEKPTDMVLSCTDAGLGNIINNY